MLVLKMAMHATVEILITSLSQLTLKNVTSHVLAIKVNSVAARGVCKYMIPDSKEIQLRCQQQRHQQARHQQARHLQPRHQQL